VDDESRWHPSEYTAGWLTCWAGTGHHALAPLAAALMGPRDLCLDDNSAGVNQLSELVLVDQHGELVDDSMGTDLYSIQAAIIDNSDILKNWELIVPLMWLSGHHFNYMG
jgi:hypothetical protein